MVEHLLVAVDGSEPSRHAARFALSVAAQLGAHVTLLTVLPRPEVIPMGPLGTSIVTAPATETDLATVRTKLDAIAREQPSVKTERVVEMGTVAETIIDYAAQHAV